MKLLYWNLYEGCREKWRLSQVVHFVRQSRLDVLGLSELNGWQDNNFKKLKAFKKQTGFKYSLFAETSSGYNLGLFSKRPFLKHEVITKKFNTGLILATVFAGGQELDLALTHLHHINEQARLKELKILLPKLNLRRSGLLFGDMNSLSPQDKYPEKLLLKQLHRMDLKKFGQKKLQKKVISKLLDFGLVDAVKLYLKNFEYSVPTAYDKDPKHFTRLRLDYIFITPPLINRTVDAKIIRSQTTQNASDHFPIEIKIK